MYQVSEFIKLYSLLVHLLLISNPECIAADFSQIVLYCCQQEWQTQSFLWRVWVGRPLCRSIKIPAIVALQWLLYKQDVRPLIRAKASCCNDTTHTYICSYSLWLHHYSNTHTHTHNHTSLLLPPTQTSIYAHIPDGRWVWRGSFIKKRQIFSYQNRNTQKKNREEGGKESDWDGFHGVRLPILLWTNQSERNQPF